MVLHSVARSLIASCLIVLPLTASAQTFTISIDPVVIPYYPATGIGSATTFIRVVQNDLPVVEVQGLSMAYSHDPTILQTASIDFAGAQLNLNGGSGPSLGNSEAHPDGANSVSVFSLVGAETIPFPTPLVLYELVFETTPAHWIGNTTGGTATFSTANPAADIPRTTTTIVVSGMGASTTWSFPTVQFVPILEFLRGDADGDGTVVAIGDAITILAGLFSGGVIDCEASADVNGDGTLNLADPISLLTYGFGGGAAPPAPFPNCGVETAPGALECNQTGC